jgi:hypothetical protein
MDDGFGVRSYVTWGERREVLANWKRAGGAHLSQDNEGSGFIKMDLKAALGDKGVGARVKNL